MSTPDPASAMPQPQLLPQPLPSPLSSPPPPHGNRAPTPHSRLDGPIAVLEPGLPPLSLVTVGHIAVFAFEAVEGTRVVAQLGGWISAEVAAALAEARALNMERRALHRDTRRVVAQLLRVRLAPVAAGVVEASAVLATPIRTRAVALRFEAFRGRWQATSITVL